MSVMPRRKLGDPAVEPWPGSRDEREAARAEAERERRARERVAFALRLADFGAAEAAGHAPETVRRLAQINAETGDDVGYIADRLNSEGHLTAAGEDWEGFGVAACVALL